MIRTCSPATPAMAHPRRRRSPTNARPAPAPAAIRKRGHARSSIVSNPTCSRSARTVTNRTPGSRTPATATPVTPGSMVQRARWRRGHCPARPSSRTSATRDSRATTAIASRPGMPISRSRTHSSVSPAITGRRRSLRVPPAMRRPSSQVRAHAPRSCSCMLGKRRARARCRSITRAMPISTASNVTSRRRHGLRPTTALRATPRTTAPRRPASRVTRSRRLRHTRSRSIPAIAATATAAKAPPACRCGATSASLAIRISSSTCPRATAPIATN